jgi:hypothetical protein
MSNENAVDPFRQKLEERRAAQEAQAVPMVFAGFPCTVIPLPWTVFTLSGRMPEYITNITLAEPGDATAAKRALTSDEVKEGEAFKRAVVCRVVVSPRIVLEGTPPEGGYTYADLFETAPEFLSGVFRWVMRGCPMTKEGEESEGLDADALANFSDKKRPRKRARARNNGKARGRKSVAASAQ